MSDSTATDHLPPARARAFVSIIVPPLVAGIIFIVVNNLTGGSANPLAGPAVFLGALGGASFIMGNTWYGAKGMAFRGGRPMFAGAGFAFLGWVALVIARFVYFAPPSEDIFLQSRLFGPFMFLLIFEAFCVHVWAFGLVFRSVHDWRGGLTAAFVSGTLFAGLGFAIFQESYDVATQAIFYFLAWGIFYGIIRLRTGGIIGQILVQAIQSTSVWVLFPVILPLTLENFNPLFYVTMAAWYAILVWRLWPTEASDFRI